jgi:thioredoxin 1
MNGFLGRVYWRKAGIILGGLTNAMQLQPLTEFDYHHTLARTPGASLVLFSSPDCGSCRKVERLLPAAVGDAIGACYKVDVQQATALARQFDLFHLPALFLYRDGHFHAALESEITPARLQEAIRAALARPAEEEP